MGNTQEVLSAGIKLVTLKVYFAHTHAHTAFSILIETESPIPSLPLDPTANTAETGVLDLL